MILKTFNFKQILNTISSFAGSKRFALFGSLIAGLVGAVPYYCEEAFILTFLSLFMQFYIVIKQKEMQRRVFLPFFCYFIGFYTPVYLFLAELYPYKRFGFSENQAIFIVICSCILIPLLHAFVESVIMMISKAFKGQWSHIIGFSCLWVIGEWILTLGTLAFPWANISVSLTGFLPYLQTSSVFGKYFITFITVFAICALVYALNDKKRFFGLLGAGIIVLNTLVGTIMFFVPTKNSETVTAAVIQGNALADEKWTSSSRQENFDRYIQLTKEAAENGAKIVVYPESAIAMAFVPDGTIHKEVAKLTKEYNITVIAGVHYYESGSNYNSVIAIMPDGSLSERYDKRHLVPFGEFIPFVDVIGKFLPFVAEFNAETGTYIEGTECVVIETDHGNVAPLVCFDSIFPDFSRDGTKNDAELLAIVTNDSWFNDSFGIYTHLRHAKLRAIENKRYILRAANTGVSCFIDDKGRVIDETQPLTVDMIYCDVQRSSDKSGYYFLGDIVLYLSFVILTINIIYSIVIRKKDNYGNNQASQNRNL